MGGGEHIGASKRYIINDWNPVHENYSCYSERSRKISYFIQLQDHASFETTSVRLMTV
jgi:hypothetical protein